MDKKALILNIQRMSTEDGPGIRTTVFFKGCSLACAWCHNPESISHFKEIQWIETKCIGCKTCINNCVNDSLIMNETGIRIDREKCIRCLKCADSCPTLAIEVKGEEWSLENLVAEVIKDRAYFEKSGGGVTVSGGEALLQGEFVCEFLKKLNELKIHTAVDTCGMCSEDTIRGVLPCTDLILYDIKLMDPVLHKRFTGQSNEKIIRNLIFIAEIMRKNENPKEIWIRTPIIPGATDFKDNIEKIGIFIKENISDVVTRWDLCAFNNLCRDKYKRLYINWLFNDTKLVIKEYMENITNIAAIAADSKDLVHWSGATRLEE